MDTYIHLKKLCAASDSQAPKILMSVYADQISSWEVTLAKKTLAIYAAP